MTDGWTKAWSGDADPAGVSAAGLVVTFMACENSAALFSPDSFRQTTVSEYAFSGAESSRFAETDPASDDSDGMAKFHRVRSTAF
jgi:hypothetical protein